MAARLGNKEFHIMIVVKRWAAIPCVEPAGWPILSRRGVFVHNCPRARRGCGVRVPVIPFSLKQVVSRERRVLSRGLAKSQRDDALFHQLVSQLQRPLFVGRAQPADDVVFPCLYCPFCGGDLVVRRFVKLATYNFSVRDIV